MSLAVIFDMDGLMFDTETVSRRVWREVAQCVGLDLGEATLDEMVGRPEAATLEMLYRRFGDAAVELAGGAQSRYRAVLEHEGVLKKPGLDALLEWLASERIPRAVATSTARALAEFKLVRARVRSGFPVVVCGDEVARGKPAPDIFLAAAERLGVPPASCVVLEDSGPGIIAAAAAGMTSVLVPDGREPDPAIREVASFTVSSLVEAQQLLESLFQTRRPQRGSKR